MTKLVIKFYLILREFKHSIFYSLFGLSSSCHHRPSCSEKTLYEIKSKGMLVGLVRGVIRVLSCYQENRLY